MCTYHYYFPPAPLAPSDIFFFFNDTATTEIYTLSLHDALPISSSHGAAPLGERDVGRGTTRRHRGDRLLDRKSTRLNSSHSQISYAVFCLKKKKKPKADHQQLLHPPSPAALVSACSPSVHQIAA